jgi:hypothetical protein
MGDMGAPSRAPRGFQHASHGAVFGRPRAGGKPVFVVTTRLWCWNAREVLGVDHQWNAQASRDGEGEGEALIIHRWKVLGAGVDEKALEADHAGVKERVHRAETRRGHPAPESNVDSELTLGRVPLGS